MNESIPVAPLVKSVWSDFRREWIADHLVLRHGRRPGAPDRPEVRSDFAEVPAFGDAGNPQNNSQFTTAVSALIKF